MFGFEHFKSLLFYKMEKITYYGKVQKKKSIYIIDNELIMALVQIM